MLYCLFVNKKLRGIIFLDLMLMSAAGAVASGMSAQSAATDPLLGEPFQVRYFDTEATSKFPSYHAALVSYPFGSYAQKAGAGPAAEPTPAADSAQIKATAEIVNAPARLATAQAADSAQIKAAAEIVNAPARPKATILYIHGFNDYFMQNEMAAKLDSAGYAFYAIDLHKYGRAYREGERMGEVLDIAEYYAELDSCIATIKREYPETPTTLMGHSTGGLIAIMYAAHRNSGKDFAAIVLNSPFLEMNMNFLARKIAVPVVSFAAKLFPDVEIPRSGKTNYGESLHKDYRGEWDYLLGLKVLGSLPVNAGWLRAIHNAHKFVQNEPGVKAPILVMHSNCSIDQKEWSEEYTRCDGVLDVEHIKEYGATLGPNVSDVEIEGGLHDLVLSKKPVRDSAYKAMLQFLDKNVPERP